MSDRNDRCSRCGQQAYYDGHERWCEVIAELVERIERIERNVTVTRNDGMMTTLADESVDPID